MIEVIQIAGEEPPEMTFAPVLTPPPVVVAEPDKELGCWDRIKVRAYISCDMHVIVSSCLKVRAYISCDMHVIVSSCLKVRAYISCDMRVTVLCVLLLVHAT